MKKLYLALLKPSGAFAKWLVFLCLVALAVFAYKGYITPLKEFLEQEEFTFKAGEYELSLYGILKGIVVLAIVFWTTAIISDFGEDRIERLRRMRASSRQLIKKLFQILLYFIAFLIALNGIGIDLTALAVFSGALGIGIGFGLQKIASNFISGLILLFERAIEGDDLIELYDGTSGVVRHTSARFTLIESPDGKEILVPNEDLITNRVINWTYSDRTARIEIPVSVSYRSDIQLARELMLGAAREQPQCANEPGPSCFLRAFNEKSVDFVLFFFVDDVTEGRFGPQSEVMFSIWNKFKANNIEFPTAPSEMHIKSLPDNWRDSADEKKPVKEKK